MNTTTQAQETAVDRNQISQTDDTPATESPALPRPAISFGVPYDKLVDEFERNTADAQAESIQASIFTPSYGQPF